MLVSFRYVVVFALILLSTVALAGDGIKHVRLPGDHGKVVSLPVYDLSQDEIAALQDRAVQLEMTQPVMRASVNTLPEVNLGMNGVPVLDQGVHGSCVTFAITGALDAALYGDDKISQLCLLELGQALEHNNPRQLSGWNGAYASHIIERIEQYGVIDKSLESSIRCGGLSGYPRFYPGIGDAMSIQDYQHYSYPLNELVKIELMPKSSRSELNIERIKQELSSGHRVLIGVYLDTDALNLGFSGNYRTYLFGDTLVLTDKLRKSIRDGSYHQLGGHHMVIYGYNDDAIVDGQRGVFYLRNSWSSLFGDYGDGYVTYDYLQLLMINAETVHEY